MFGEYLRIVHYGLRGDKDSRIGRFLLIIISIFILFSMNGCDTSKDETITTTEEIDIPNENIEQTDSSSKDYWESYLSEVKSDRNFLEIKTPNRV